MDSKFGSLWGGWCFNEPLGYGVGLWKNIKRGCGMFSSHTIYGVADGSKVFWHDLCCRNKALKEAFPDLYGIGCTKDTSVAAHLELSSDFNQ